MQIWLFENTDMRIEGRIIVSCQPLTAGLRGRACRCACADEEPTWQGFDEYMNLVLDDAEEMSIKKKSRKPLGERLLPEHTPGACGSHSEAACAASTVAHHAARRVGREDSAQGGQHYAHDERHAPRGLSPAGAQCTCSALLSPPSAHLLKKAQSELCVL